MARIAVISTAHIHTRGYLENIVRATDGRRLHVIWDDVAERGQRYASEFEAPFVPDLDAVVRDSDVDGFLVCAENARHAALLKKVLPTGRPVFCEKPLTTTVREARQVAAWQRRYGTPIFCGYFLPFGREMRAAAREIAAGTLGRVTRARFRNAHHAAYGRWFDAPDLRWFHDPDLSGGGAFMDMGTHAIHLLRTLFGPVTKVWAEIRNESGEYPACDDFGVAHLRFANGLLGTVEAAWTQTGGIGGLEVVGSAATLWNTGAGYVVGAPKKTPNTLPPADERPSRVDRLVAVVRGQIPAADLQADLEAVLDSVAIMEAAYRSARTGRWTPVADMGTATGAD